MVNIVRGSRTSGEEDYAFYAPSGETRSIQTTDTTGGLRMVRVGDVITAYIRSGSHWLRFASGHHAGPVQIRPILWASGSDFAHKDVTVDFDNFVVEAPSDPCL